MDAAGFRAAFPAFAEPAAVPDAAIVAALAMGGALVDAARWGALADRGTGLYAAHVLTLDARRASGATGPVAGLASKAIGGVSASYDAGAAGFTGGGDLNGTGYGQEFLRLQRLFGMGAVQL